MNKNHNWLNTQSQEYLQKTNNISVDTNDMIYKLLFENKEGFSQKISNTYNEIFERLWWKNILQTRRKKIIMSIVVELLENIYKHWEVSKNHNATFEFYEEDNSLFFETINYIKEWNIEKIKEKTMITDSNNIQEIKNAYKNQILNWGISEVWGNWNWVFRMVKEVKSAYPEINTKDIFQKNIIWLNWDTKIKVKIMMPNRDSESSKASK